jgi:hypothetical protein
MATGGRAAGVYGLSTCGRPRLTAGLMLVEVYRNLNRKCLSIRDPEMRKVIGHVDSVLLLGARFVVSEAGRQRVLRTRQKNVHAVVRGIMVAQPTRAPEWKRVRYDPYAAETFVWQETGEPAYGACRVYIGPEGMYAEKPLEISGS